MTLLSALTLGGGYAAFGDGFVWRQDTLQLKSWSQGHATAGCSGYWDLANFGDDEKIISMVIVPTGFEAAWLHRQQTVASISCAEGSRAEACVRDFWYYYSLKGNPWHLKVYTFGRFRGSNHTYGSLARSYTTVHGFGPGTGGEILNGLAFRTDVPGHILVRAAWCATAVDHDGPDGTVLLPYERAAFHFERGWDIRGGNIVIGEVASETTTGFEWMFSMMSWEKHYHFYSAGPVSFPLDASPPGTWYEVGLQASMWNVGGEVQTWGPFHRFGQLAVDGESYLDLRWLPNCFLVGDINGDGCVTFDDVEAFLEAISLPETEFELSHPTWIWIAADTNGDGRVNFDDIDGLVARIGTCCST